MVRLKGAGVGRSFISGAPDPDTGGAGPGAVRPIGAFCHNMCVQGFTIRDGWSLKSSSATENYVSAVQGRTKDWTATGNALTIADCLITNCTSAPAGGTLVRNAVLERCRVMGNTADTAIIAYNNRVSSCLVSGNTVSASGGATMGSCTMANSTVVGSYDKSLLGSSATAYASILERGTTLYADNRLYGTLAWDVAADAAGGDWRFGAPCFADPGAGDYRLLSMSPARSAGEAPSAENWGTNWWKMASTGDVDGNRLLFDGARILAGAVQAVVEARGAYVAARNGGLSAAEGYHALSGGETLEVGIGQGTRPTIGVMVDGVTNLFDEASGPYVVTSADSSYIEAIYTSDWYVDASKESDDGYGFTPGTAKKTFKGIFDGGLVVAGDTVHAAEGTYSNGVMVASGETVGSRVLVPANVTVVADGAAERTIILGAAANPGANTYGLGTNAVRCASLGSGSVIRGFTLTGGRTGRFYSGTEDGKEYKENVGGGVYGRGRNSGVAECCIISNNVAFRGGGAAYTTLRKCRVYGNYGTDTQGNGSAMYRGSAEGTLFKGNTGTYGVMYVGSLTGCTVIHGGTDNNAGVYATSSCTLRNCIIRCGCNLKTTKGLAYYTYFERAPVSEASYHNLGEGSNVVGADRLQLDDDGRPVVGANDAIDKANTSYYSAAALGDTDASGFQRVMNGALDCGALEADWRPKFAADICRNTRAFKVVSATENVVETNSTVVVSPGQVLEATWKNATGKEMEHAVAFRVTGNGELALQVNGETRTYTSADGDVVYRFSSALASSTLVFAYTGGEDDEGGAEILSASRQIGFALFVR